MKLITKLLDSSKLEPFKTAWHGLWSTCTFVINQKKIIILKLDFEKAFDRIEHTTTLQLMKVKGFGNIWLKWMQQFLSPLQKRSTAGRSSLSTTLCFGSRLLADSDQQSQRTRPTEAAHTL
jgi:hypothetical protein